MLKAYGLIGYPLSHSFSKDYFNRKFAALGLNDYTYENFPLKSISEFSSLVSSQPSLYGLNVTIPYKKSVLPFLDDIDELAEKTGAVNTIKLLRSADTVKLKGYNTDVYGFASSLKPFLQNHHHRALILGTGGASEAVAFVLRSLGIDLLFASRNPTAQQIAYDQIGSAVLSSYPLIVNTTPAGMFPNTEEAPLKDFTGITDRHLLYDVIYNPEETLFLREGKKRGAVTMNGLNMLHLQAEKAWEIWNSNE